LLGFLKTIILLLGVYGFIHTIEGQHAKSPSHHGQSIAVGCLIQAIWAIPIKQSTWTTSTKNNQTNCPPKNIWVTTTNKPFQPIEPH
jgi:hypothetical protein